MASQRLAELERQGIRNECCEPRRVLLQRISVKLNSRDGDADGFSHDDARATVRMLGRIGADLVETSGGTYARPTMQGDAMKSGVFFADA